VATAEPVSPTSSRPVQRTLLTQGRRDVTFLHWPVDPALVAPLHTAELLVLEGDLVATAGLPSVGGAPNSLLFYPGVDVRFGPRMP
jgi:uncharacterized protein YqjF (DUF2071 family)